MWRQNYSMLIILIVPYTVFTCVITKETNIVPRELFFSLSVIIERVGPLGQINYSMYHALQERPSSIIIQKKKSTRASSILRSRGVQNQRSVSTSVTTNCAAFVRSRESCLDRCSQHVQRTTVKKKQQQQQQYSLFITQINFNFFFGISSTHTYGIHSSRFVGRFAHSSGIIYYGKLSSSSIKSETNEFLDGLRRVSAVFGVCLCVRFSISIVIVTYYLRLSISRSLCVVRAITEATVENMRRIFRDSNVPRLLFVSSGVPATITSTW